MKNLQNISANSNYKAEVSGSAMKSFNVEETPVTHSMLSVIKNRITYFQPTQEHQCSVPIKSESTFSEAKAF